MFLLAGCQDDDGVRTPDGFFDCESIASSWSAQSNAYLVFHYPQDITFISANDAVAVSRSGQISRSSDGGRTWTVTETYWNGTVANENATTRARLWTVQAINGDLIYAAGEDEDDRRFDGDIETDAVFLTSADGGRSWDKRYATGLSGISDIRFIDADQGFALGAPNENPADQRIWLFATEDGGESWNPTTLAYDRLASPKFLDRPEAVSHVVKINTQDEYALLTLNTLDGTWAESPLPDNAQYTVRFVTRDFGTAVNHEGLWVTEDGGTTWTLRQQEVVSAGTLLYLSDEENWLAINRITKIETGGGEAWEVLLYYEVSETKDGGTTWETRKVAKDCDYVNSFNGLVVRTPDNGFLTVASRSNLIRFMN